ncbi:MAG: GNAT family N-acetyltransferase [Dongiaceae bacterium]
MGAGRIRCRGPASLPARVVADGRPGNDLLLLDPGTGTAHRGAIARSQDPGSAAGHRGSRMSEYYGTDEQVRLQRRVIESIGWIAATPGACNSGRFLGCDELDRLGWDALLEILRRDGAVGFRMLPSERAPAVASRLASFGFRLDTWDVFAGDRAAALSIAEAAAQGLPAPFRDIEIPAIPDDRLLTGLQALMAENGIVPFPAALLTGRAAPAVLAAVEDGSGRPAAVAFGYLPHNAHSPWRRWAFVGLVAVDKAHRGQGLGRHVNARAVAGVLRQLEAETVYELVHASNLPSRRMVESSGLQLHPGLKAGIATVADAGRFTR